MMTRPFTPDWLSTTTARLIDDGVLEIGDGYRARNAEFAEEGIPFLRIGSLVGHGRLDLNGAPRFPEDELSRVGPKVSRPMDCVIATKATIGRIGFIPATGVRVVYSPQVSYWRVRNHQIVSPRFLRYWLQGEEFRTQGIAAKGSTAMADYINLNDQRRMAITLPPLPLQHRIASALGAYDELIENNLRRIDILEQMARTVYADFVRQDNSNNWLKEPFAAIATITRTNVDPRRHAQEHFDHFSFAAFDRDRLPEGVVSDTLKAGKFLVDEDSVLLAKLNPRIPRVWLARPMKERRSIASSEFLVLRPTPHVTIEFLYLLCSSDDYRSQIVGLAGGTSTSHQRVKPEDLRGIGVRVPPKEVIDVLTNHVRPLLALSDTLRRINRILSSSRDLLLPKLISGEIDVSTLDIDTSWLAA